MFKFFDQLLKLLILEGLCFDYLKDKTAIFFSLLLIHLFHVSFQKKTLYFHSIFFWLETTCY